MSPSGSSGVFSVRTVVYFIIVRAVEVVTVRVRQMSCDWARDGCDCDGCDCDGYDGCDGWLTAAYSMGG